MKKCNKHQSEKSSALDLETIFRGVEEKARLREQRRKEFAEKTPEPEMCLVAWVDILGFKEKIRNARTEDEFKAVYDKVRRVHEEFAKESASDDPEFQAKENKTYGRRVISLSDGLVVVQSMNAEARIALDPYGFIQVFMDDLRMAQAQCAYQGIFLRGGIDFGRFWFDDDILLSPALVEAYIIETDISKNPAILVKTDLVDQIAELKGKPANLNGRELVRECEWLEGENRGKYLMLDYMDIIANEDHGWHSEEDREAWQDRSRPPEERDAIFNESRHRIAGDILRSMKQKLIKAYADAPTECVKNKYRWLIRYFNESFRHDFPAFEGAAIDENDPVSLVDVPKSACR
jgi:hypothetical protein